MITLKDIKVSKNRIPVQNAVWVRPVGGLKFKIYYPHGGDWEEMGFDGTSPSPEPTPTPTPSDYDALKKEVEELRNDVVRLSNSSKSMSSSIDALSDDIRDVNIIAKEGQVNAYTAYMNSEERTATEQIILSPRKCSNVIESDIPKYDMTVEVLDAICEAVEALPPLASIQVKMYRLSTSAPHRMTLKNFMVAVTKEDDVWSSITFTELSLSLFAKYEEITVSREKKSDQTIARSNYYYTVNIKVVNPEPLTPGL